MDASGIQHDNGDVVIVVPAMEGDKTDSILVSELAEHSVCIDAEEGDLEPISPKTITESSSKYSLSSKSFPFSFFYFFNKCKCNSVTFQNVCFSFRW